MQQELKETNFELIIGGFNKAIESYPPIEKVSNELNEMIEVAKNDNELTFWQKEAIIARCKNYLNGEYGQQVEKPDYRSAYSRGLK